MKPHYDPFMPAARAYFEELRHKYAFVLGGEPHFEALKALFEEVKGGTGRPASGESRGVTLCPAVPIV